jgi:hypothetical protein
MKRFIRIDSLMYPLRRLLVKGLRFERQPFQATIPGLMPPPQPWYWALILETLKTMLLVIAGFSLSIILVAIMYYTGNDPLYNPIQ